MKKFLSLILCSLLFLSACDSQTTPVSGSFQSMDTFMQLDIYGSEDDLKIVESEILEIGNLLDTTYENSDIYRLNETGSARLNDTTADVLKQSLELCAELDGYLDISIYPIVEEWGFISGDYNIPESKRLFELLENVDYKKVKLNENTAELSEGMRLDLGAVAKGYAADVAVDMLSQKGVKSGILNLGGTVAAMGKKPTGEDWKIGITDPENTASHFGYVQCRDKIVATSGNYERYFEQDGKRYCHIINPKTGVTVENGTVSVTVISDSGIKSDALSTALFVMGIDKAQEYWKSSKDFDFILLDNSDTLYVTEGIAEDFKLIDGYDFEMNILK